MALLAEEIVEEWLNRQGYFTIRGIKLGVDEVDILAIQPQADGTLTHRHIEVQASMRPAGYISKVPKAVRKETGRAPSSAKARSAQELAQGVAEWVHNKFDKPNKVKLRNGLSAGDWSRELVIHRIKSADEVRLIEKNGVMIHHLSMIVRDLAGTEMPLQSAGGEALLDLIQIAVNSKAESNDMDMINAAVYTRGKHGN